jgi:hypothetical protein
MRITDTALQELIENEGELKSGPISATGILRLALDLQDARKELLELGEMLGQATRPKRSKSCSSPNSTTKA